MNIVVSAYGFPMHTGDQGLTYYHRLVCEVYDQYFIRHTLTNATRLNVIDELRALWGGDFPQYDTLESWLLGILSSYADRLDDMHLLVIEDTLAYLKTGLRKFPIPMYAKILPYRGELGKNTVGSQVTMTSSLSTNRRQRIHALVQLIREMQRAEPLYLRWTKDEESLMDMIAFLRVILEPQPTI